MATEGEQWKGRGEGTQATAGRRWKSQTPKESGQYKGEPVPLGRDHGEQQENYAEGHGTQQARCVRADEDKQVIWWVGAGL